MLNSPLYLSLMSNAPAAFTQESPNLTCSQERNCLAPCHCLQRVLITLTAQISERILLCSSVTLHALSQQAGRGGALIEHHYLSRRKHLGGDGFDQFQPCGRTHRPAPAQEQHQGQHQVAQQPSASLHRKQQTCMVAFKCFCSPILKQILL